MMSLWDALRMNMMISYQELVRTFPKNAAVRSFKAHLVFGHLFLLLEYILYYSMYCQNLSLYLITGN
ncbi:hypothetical protein P0228_24445, partial [Escherichia coli]